MSVIPSSMSYEQDGPLGHTEPRLWTPPLRALTPETSYGFDVIDFANEVLRLPLDPWEEWAVIHAGELLEDGRPRFRKVLIIVARQNGKTHLCVVLSLYWLFVERQKMILGTSTNLMYAKESWLKAIEIAEANPYLASEIPPPSRNGTSGVTRAIGNECLTTKDGCKYRIAASNRRGGRSLTINRLILDELREHDSWDAWGAATNAMNAVPDAQAVAITNQGDDSSIVLDSLRDSALSYLKDGKGDPRLGIFEWSAPDGADPTDVNAIAAANPNLGRRIELDSILGDAQRARLAGGQELATFRTEVLCQRVNHLDPAVDPDGWSACVSAGTMDQLRDRVALCVDVSMNARHATLVAAAVQEDGTVRVEVIHHWSGPGCTNDLRKELPTWVAAVKPALFGWFPSGPAAVVAADLADPQRRYGYKTAWPPRGTKVEEIRAEVTTVCMSFSELVTGHLVAHSDDPLLNKHVENAQKQRQGDAWRFSRQGDGDIDAVYAAAGAVHLAKILPPPKPKLAVV
ncbi:phage terminase large subunit-like protein [Prauserella shujinwangii]|uniref:Phage terminase large subunit-like protein n=1 Tax=Prauserella shujinwangii TaxID=1453103 RepID=A0A2T0LSV8_9PSEU|nr:phage terminase large subunit-like protein [Prauserella shujinwangii]